MLDSFFYAIHMICKRLLVILLLLGLEGGLGDTVQITLAGLCDAATTFVLILLEDTNLLESLHDLAVDGAGSVSVVGWAGATVLGGSTSSVSIPCLLSHLIVVFVPVSLAHAANTDGLAHVDVTSDSSGADVEPVDVLGRHLLGVYASLDVRTGNVAVSGETYAMS
jgi:hypothetical protein